MYMRLFCQALGMGFVGAACQAYKWPCVSIIPSDFSCTLLTKRGSILWHYCERHTATGGGLGNSWLSTTTNWYCSLLGFNWPMKSHVVFWRLETYFKVVVCIIWIQIFFYCEVLLVVSAILTQHFFHVYKNRLLAEVFIRLTHFCISEIWQLTVFLMWFMCFSW